MWISRGGGGDRSRSGLVFGSIARVHESKEDLTPAPGVGYWHPRLFCINYNGLALSRSRRPIKSSVNSSNDVLLAHVYFALSQT